MNDKIKVAVLGSTGYVGIELVKILLNHPNVSINFLGCENFVNKKISDIDSSVINSNLPNLSINSEFNPNNSDLVFLSLPHGVSHLFVKKYFDKIKIIDLSADFRLDSDKIYESNYNIKHSCPELLSKFFYGLKELKNSLKDISNVAVPGCYPTSILLPLIPLIKYKLVSLDNIIIDSKSGYSGAGKKFNLERIKKKNELNFYNYNTNNHRHICEIQQELNKASKKNINFSFNPHILPSFRGMMSTIYCDLSIGINSDEIKNTLIDVYKNSNFVRILKDNENADLFEVQNTNNCLIKLFKHNSTDKLIIVSLIDNLLQGAAGQAVQCLNSMYNIDDSTSLILK